jgi:hypothetical protein
LHKKADQKNASQQISRFTFSMDCHIRCGIAIVRRHYFTSEQGLLDQHRYGIAAGAVTPVCV